MPTLEVQRADLEALIGETLTSHRLSSLLTLVKGELKGPEIAAASGGDPPLKIELNDTNRPDLWSPEGIARQIRAHLKGAPAIYPFFKTRAKRKVYVSEAVMPVRPYLAGCIARGLTITPPMLAQLIQSQEKLADIFGQKRKTVSIGLYPLYAIAFPIQYDLADPETRFIPLGCDRPMSLSEILKSHPKGIAYGGILKGQTRFPLLRDAKGQILSFPPIINSRETGEVKVGDTDLFVEVTGCSLRMVILAANIFACNLFDHLQSGAGGAIEAVEIVFPRETDFGRSVKTPYDFSQPIAIASCDFERALGEPVSRKAAQSFLTAYGYRVTDRGGKKQDVRPPPYRDDVMHPIDVVEDFAMSRGFHTFAPAMPQTATIGARSAASSRITQCTDLMVGLGFEEVFSNVLLSRLEQIDRMRLDLAADRPERRVISLENPMTDRHAAPRSWLLPVLLRVEAASAKAYYPHRLFEMGEVARMTKSESGCETALHLAALLAYSQARFSELHAVLFAFLRALSVSCRIVPSGHPSFIEGRFGLLFKEDCEIGFIGEIHPEVLTAWEIGMPAAAFELDAAHLGSAS